MVTYVSMCRPCMYHAVCLLEPRVLQEQLNRSRCHLRTVSPSNRSRCGPALSGDFVGHIALLQEWHCDLWAYYNCDTSTIRVRFERDTTSYEELCAFEQ